MTDADKFDPLAKAKAHFREIVAEKTTTITVPEWGLEFQVKPTTLAQRDAQFQRGQVMSLRNAAHLIVERALVDGVPLFAPVEVNALCNMVDSVVLLRVSSEIVSYDRRVWGTDLAEADEGDADLSEVDRAKKP